MIFRIYTLAPRARLEQTGGDRLLLSDFPLRQFRLSDSAWHVLNALDGTTPLHELVNGTGPELLGYL